MVAVRGRFKLHRNQAASPAQVAPPSFPAGFALRRGRGGCGGACYDPDAGRRGVFLLAYAGGFRESLELVNPLPVDALEGLFFRGSIFEIRSPISSQLLFFDWNRCSRFESNLQRCLESPKVWGHFGLLHFDKTTRCFHSNSPAVMVPCYSSSETQSGKFQEHMCIFWYILYI